MLPRLTKILTNKLAFTHPRKRYVYAVTGGTYLGEMLVYIDKVNNNYSFLSLPEMKVRDIPIEKFEFGIKESIVDIVEKIPKYAYNTCKAQYYKNKSTH